MVTNMMTEEHLLHRIRKLKEKKSEIDGEILILTYWLDIINNQEVKNEMYNM